MPAADSERRSAALSRERSFSPHLTSTSLGHSTHSLSSAECIMPRRIGDNTEQPARQNVVWLDDLVSDECADLARDLREDGINTSQSGLNLRRLISVRVTINVRNGDRSGYVFRFT